MGEVTPINGASFVNGTPTETHSIKKDDTQIGSLSIEFEFTDHTKVCHTIPIQALSLISYAVNRNLSDKTMDEFIVQYLYELRDIINAYSNLYKAIGLDIKKVKLIKKD